MPLAAIVTILAVALIAGALAIYLTTIAIKLREVSFNLGTILIGVWSIANQCAPLREIVGEIVGEVEGMEADIGRLPVPGTRGARARRR